VNSGKFLLQAGVSKCAPLQSSYGLSYCVCTPIFYVGCFRLFLSCGLELHRLIL